MQALRHFINPVTGEIIKVMVRYYSDKKFQQSGISCAIKLRKSGPLGQQMPGAEHSHIFNDPGLINSLLEGKTLKL